MDAAPTPIPTEAYLPDFTHRIALIVAGLLALVARRFGTQPAIIHPLWRRITRVRQRIERLTARLASTRAPRRHTGGRPHPENLLRGSPVPTGYGWLVHTLGYQAAGYRVQLDSVLAEPAAKELLARIPAIERILRPLRRMLGSGPYDPTRRPRKGGRTSAAQSADATLPAPAPPAVAPPPPVPHERPVMTSRGLVWVRDPPLPTRLIRHSIV